jgi:signal-transduction protein with cAMP-binding, CBS, and nucleotidyltransferase domain
MTIGSPRHQLTVGEICERRIPTAPASTTVLAAAKSMNAFGDRLVVVTDRLDGRLRALGVVTERELAAVIAREGDPSRLTLAEVMHTHPGFVTESDGILETALWMRHNFLREVIVHDGQGALLGIVGMDRLIESLAAELDGVAHAGLDAPAPSQRGAFH